MWFGNKDKIKWLMITKTVHKHRIRNYIINNVKKLRIINKKLKIMCMYIHIYVHSFMHMYV